MSDESNALAFERLGEPPGVEVIDRIEQQRYSIYTPEPVCLQPSRTDAFHFPVGRAIEFDTRELTVGTVVSTFVRNSQGEMIAEVDHKNGASLPSGSYSLELSAQIKTYVEFDAAVEVSAGPVGTTVRFDEPTTVRVGIRSRHERPAGTITTTSDPRDLMAAVETFGSALKTTDPERSYPTLRGHPPAVELGDELSIPDGLESPETGITLELPLTLETIYVAAPLAYYLGADLEPGVAPKLVTDDGFEYPLEGAEGFETAVSNTLKQLFFLDCITRTEGLYQVPLEERRRVEPLVDLDFAELYTSSLSEQVATYLEVPFDVVEDHLPEWPLSTHISPAPETVEQLPFVVDDLAVIHIAGRNPASVGQGPPPEVTTIARDDVLTRSAGQSEGNADSFVQLDTTDAVEQAWIGDDIPIGASKLTTEAFHNRLDREVTNGDIEIAIVLNDDRMVAERDVVDRVYGDRDNLPFDISIHRNTTVSELRTLLSRQRGFLHYIGHTEHDGFECSDGKLDAADLDDVGIESFLLNACKSYNQGLNLIEAGAVGGIVTLTDIIDTEAVSIGSSIARLLNAGFPLRASLTLAKNESIQGGQYIVVGDGSMAVTQAESRVPISVEINRADEGFEVDIFAFATDNAGIGTIYIPYLDKVDKYFLCSGTNHTFNASRDELEEFFRLEEAPIRANGELFWSSTVEIDDL